MQFAVFDRTPDARCVLLPSLSKRIRRKNFRVYVASQPGYSAIHT